MMNPMLFETFGGEVRNWNMQEVEEAIDTAKIDGRTYLMLDVRASDDHNIADIMALAISKSLNVELLNEEKTMKISW